MVSGARPSPSLPSSSASRGMSASRGSRSESESSRKASAAVAKPMFRSRSMPGTGHWSARLPSRVQGTWNTVPMLTRTARRDSGSQQPGVSSTASTPSAAAERKIAPTLVASTMFSSTATRLAPAQMSSARGSGRRRRAHSTPRVSW